MKNPAEFAASQSLYPLLTQGDRDFWLKAVETYQLTQSEARMLMLDLRDIQMWGDPSPAGIPGILEMDTPYPTNKKSFHASISTYVENLKETGGTYSTDAVKEPRRVTDGQNIGVRWLDDSRNIMGSCPVASEKTRCCNLHTLDAVFRCAYDCSYCSIQSFYDEGRVSFHKDLPARLEAIELDPDTYYHIGTGQSSDSLLWGNRDGMLDHLNHFAAKHPNIILEFKTKSANIDWLLEANLAQNILVTWSLNTPAAITWEEHGTASLEQRLKAAHTCASRGIPIGFHFHPMMRYEGWKDDYKNLFNDLKSMFKQEQLVCISLGTLTFIKPVLKKIRNRDFRSSILKMPLVETVGRYSYPREVKQEMFTVASESLGDWKDEVFTYLCMEDAELWEPVLGRSYPNNDAFETDMITTYRQRMRCIHKNHYKNR